MPRRGARDLRTDREVRETLSQDLHAFFDCGGRFCSSVCQNPLLFSHSSHKASPEPPLLNSAGSPVRLAHRRRRRRGCVPPTFPWVARQDLRNGTERDRWDCSIWLPQWTGGSPRGKANEPVVADQEAPVNGGSQACEKGQGAGGPSSRSGDSGGSAWAPDPLRSHIQSRLRQHLRR